MQAQVATHALFARNHARAANFHRRQLIITSWRRHNHTRARVRTSVLGRLLERRRLRARVHQFERDDARNWRSDTSPRSSSASLFWKCMPNGDISVTLQMVLQNAAT